MKRFRLTKSAARDLLEIWTSIAPFNEIAADQLEAEIYEACARIAGRPDLGHFRRDLTKSNVRFFNVRGRFLIVYDAQTDPLQISRIFHGARDAKRELRKDPGDD